MTEKEYLIRLLKILNASEERRIRYRAEIEKYERQLEEAKLIKYRLGVIGVTSSGKSTMINALLGKELLSSGILPSSSQLVSCSKSERDRVTIYFADRMPIVLEEDTRKLKSKIKEYSDERKNKNNKYGVKQLELSTAKYELPEDVLLIDSPGLDAYGLEGHEKLTMKTLLPTIDFCIFVTTIKDNTLGKMRDIFDIIAEYDCPMLIAQNMIDSVKPKADGSKTAKQVAEDCKRSVLKVVNSSKIKDKESIRVVQISAKYALEATKRVHTKSEREKRRRSSNIDKLIREVHLAFDKIRPNVEYRRLQRLVKQTGDIADQAEIDIGNSPETAQIAEFEYEGYDEEIKKLYSETQDNMKELLEKFDKVMIICSDKGKVRYTEEIIKAIKDGTKKVENRLLHYMSEFREQLDFYCELLGVDAKRLHVLDSFGHIPELKLYTVLEKRVKVKGIGGGLLRALGFILDIDHLGYETKEVYDHEATDGNVKNYIVKVTAMFHDACDNWENDAKTQVDRLLVQFRNEKEAYENRKKRILDQENSKELTQKLVQELRLLIEQVPTNPPPDISGPHSEGSTSPDNYVTVSLDAVTYTMFGFAKRMQAAMHNSVFKTITGDVKGTKNVLFGWDVGSMDYFVRRNFYSLSDRRIADYEVCMNPNKTLISELVLSEERKRYFVLFNAIQLGSGESDVSRSGIADILAEDDELYFVIQDFDELIIGGGIAECIREMSSFGSKLGIKPRYKLMINHSNPIYNLLLGEIQRRWYGTQADEMTLLHDIQSDFEYLCSPKVNKIMNQIMKGLKQAGGNDI